ncbi:MAG: hypothetical protein ICV83_10165 [Cytophagales bacterium]|nr:hypothetical protein [Cytophagales bacterium]
MRRTFRQQLMTLLVLAATAHAATAQEEKVTLQTGEEEMDTSRFAGLLRTYNQVVRAREEERTLIKVDLLGPALYAFSFGGNNDSTERNVSNVVRLAVERKFRPDWSWIAGTTIQADTRAVRDVGLMGGVRYYYNLNRRILKGKSANNFSANYLGLQATGRTRPRRDQQQVALQLLYGIQRRIFGWAYLDVNAGISARLKKYPEQRNVLDLVTAVQVGLAF